jgi:hypothetical protein
MSAPSSGGSVLQRRLHGRDDLVQRIRQRFEDFIAGNREAARHALGQVAALDFHFLDFRARKGRADAFLDRLGGGFANQHAVVAADVVDDGVVEAVATDAHAALVDHAAQRDHADLGGAAADVHDHGAAGFADGQAGANRGRHRLFDQINLGGASAQRRFTDRAPLDLGGSAGHADDDARAGTQHTAGQHHLDELLEHLLGDSEVGDHAVLHRANRLDVARHLAQHRLGFLANGLNGLLSLGAPFVANGDDRRFVEHDALVANDNQGVGGAEVNGQVGRKVPTEGT